MSSVYELFTASPGFVNPSFNVVSCNDLVLTSGNDTKNYSYSQSGSSLMPSGTVTRTLADTPVVASSSFDLPSNAYTASRDMIVSVSSMMSCSLLTGGGLPVNVNISLVINNLTFPMSVVSFPSGVVGTIFTLSSVNMIKLNAGDVLRYEVNNSSSGSVNISQFRTFGLVQ